MLDFKSEQKWPLIPEGENAFKGHFYFWSFFGIKKRRTVLPNRRTDKELFGALRFKPQHIQYITKKTVCKEKIALLHINLRFA